MTAPQSRVGVAFPVGATHPTPRAGDVVRYESERRNSWCREGMAIAVERNGGLIYVDTYWGGMGSDSHVLTDGEVATAVLVFNLADYDELDRYSSASRETWRKYAPADRETVTSQHRLQARWFVRKGAHPDFATQIQNARERVAEAESGVRSAESGLDWARRDLAAIEALAVAAGRRANPDVLPCPETLPPT